MADDRRQGLSPEALAALLEKLDEVMAEAERLRKEVTRQLSVQRADQQQRISDATRKKRRLRKR